MCFSPRSSTVPGRGDGHGGSSWRPLRGRADLSGAGLPVGVDGVRPPGPAAVDSETVNVNVVVPALPSASVTSSIVRVAVSSLVIVPWPWPSPTVAPVTFVTLTKNVSVGSIAVSPLTVTSKV